ncbi:MAG: bifunctional nuclease family protein [Planctomycetaceae bacterium]|nr:bifunctional nuclease family protein [Planctomycetaceae bacterium]
MLVHMELSRIIISEIGDKQAIFLNEVDGDRVMQIVIGFFEATSIDRRVSHDPQLSLGRPMTHELMKSIIDELGGEAQDIVINEMVEHTYYARIRIKQGEETIKIDARPSDAVALAMHFDPPLPIYVDEDVLELSA